MSSASYATRGARKRSRSFKMTYYVVHFERRFGTRGSVRTMDRGEFADGASRGAGVGVAEQRDCEEPPPWWRQGHKAKRARYTA